MIVTCYYILWLTRFISSIIISVTPNPKSYLKNNTETYLLTRLSPGLPVLSRLLTAISRITRVGHLSSIRLNPTPKRSMRQNHVFLSRKLPQSVQTRTRSGHNKIRLEVGLVDSVLFIERSRSHSRLAQIGSRAGQVILWAWKLLKKWFNITSFFC